MNRRDFVKAVAGVAALGHLRTTLLAQAGNPKVVFFGMAVIRADNNTPISVFLPAAHNHMAFMLAHDAPIKALGGTPVASSTMGLAEAHIDLANPLRAWCLEGVTLIIGTGNGTLAVGLRDRLPSISSMARRFAPATSYRFDPSTLLAASCSATLGGGTLREPGTPSRSAATFAGIGWNFYAGPSKTHIGGPFNLTDLSVFESSLPSLTITVGARTHTMSPGETIWILNMPTFHSSDNTETLIENAHDWLSLVAPTFPAIRVSAEATVGFTRLTGTNSFLHPCASTPEKQEAAQASHIEHMKALGIQPWTVRAYIPPDTDPCFSVRP